MINGGCIITANQYGVYALGGSLVSDQNPAPVITGNTIELNTTYNYYADNFYNAALVKLTTTDNYWGSVDPLFIYQTIRDRMDAATNAPYVDFGHYLDAASGAVVKQNYLLGPVSGTLLDTSDSYEVLGDLLVAQGQTLLIQQGVQLDFLADYQLIVNGTLDVQGAQAANVVFTTGESVKNISDWKGIQINATALNVSIDYARIEYAERGIEFNGSGGIVTNSSLQNNNYGVYVTGANASPVINSGNLLANNTYGVYVFGSGVAGSNPAPVVNGNSIYNNTNMNYYAANFYQPAVTVLDATSNWWNLTVASQVAATIYDQSDSPGSPHVNFGQYLDAQNGSPVVANSLIGPVSGTLDTLSGGVYEVLGDIQVAAGNQLTIDAGVSLLFIDNATLTVDGSFTVQGTALEPVSFSSATASAGAWQGIQVNPTATSVSIDQAIIEYATYGIYFNESAAVGTVSNTVLSSNSRGIYLRGNASPVIGGGNRIDNNQYGLYLEGLGTTGNSPLPTINGNEIYANSSYDVYTV